MKKRMEYNVWGPGASRLGELPGHVMRDREERPIQAVRRMLERVTGLTVVICRHDSVSSDDLVYQLTLGKRIKPRLGGGWSVEAELWVSVPRVKP